MRVLAALLVSSPLWAQGISLGLRAGVPITPVLAADGPQQASEPRFTIGPLIEVHLWRGAALGADFLLRRSDLAFSPAGSRSAEVWRVGTPSTPIYRGCCATRPFLRARGSFVTAFAMTGRT